MNIDLIHKLFFAYGGNHDHYAFPSFMNNSIQIISDHFGSDSNNKVCFVYPAKDYIAQWLSIPMTLSLIEKDFKENNNIFFESYKQYRIGDKLLLNNRAIVEWAGISSKGVSFKTKAEKESSGAIITIRFVDVLKLQKSPSSRKKLSSIKLVKEALPASESTPMDKLLDISTCGNREFIKSQIAMICKFKQINEVYENFTLNSEYLSEYFKIEKIKDNGISTFCPPLVVSNTITDLLLHQLSLPKSTSAMIIDGYDMIEEKSTDFSDLDKQNIPTILITDLSEIDKFGIIKDLGFCFYDFTYKTIDSISCNDNSPFNTLNKKIKRYTSFRCITETCYNNQIETLVGKIHMIQKDELNQNLISIKVSFVQIANHLSRIVYIPESDEIKILSEKIYDIEKLFNRVRIWLGESITLIEDCIGLIKSLITHFSEQPGEKSVVLKKLLNNESYDYIITPTQYQINSLESFISGFSLSYYPKIITINEINDIKNSAIQTKAILVGWPKSGGINKIFASCLFSELTMLFYPFEKKYFTSYQRKKNQNIQVIKPWIKASETTKITNDSFGTFSAEKEFADNSQDTFDITEFEKTIDQVQYSKYSIIERELESVKTKRIDFENNTFIYSSESHKFIVLNKSTDKKEAKSNYHRRKADYVKPKDLIVLINTEKDILIDIVEKHTKPEDLAPVKQWVSLWKNLLKEYYDKIDNDFNRLVENLRKYDCMKHEVTIKTWLQDDTRIGPDDDSDLLSIALLTESDILYNNVDTVRKAIRQMKSWRINASNFIIKKIKSKIHEFAKSENINQKITVEGLGIVSILKVVYVSDKWENINIKYVNKTLQKEII